MKNLIILGQKPFKKPEINPILTNLLILNRLLNNCYRITIMVNNTIKTNFIIS